MGLNSISTKSYCNCLAKSSGLDPVGHARSFDTAIIIEAPLPWRLGMTREAGVLQQPVIDLFALWLQRYYDGHGYPNLPLVVAPDTEYSQDGFRRVMYFTRPMGLFSQFDKIEYNVPEDLVGELVWSLYEDQERLAQFMDYRAPEGDSIRDILVCTHGTVDAACAKFGYPIYKFMRENYSSDALRVWRVSHFGGHVFAPTFMDMPIGHYWAYVENEQAQQIIDRTGDVRNLWGYYRGWAGVSDGFLQVAEGELWQRYGWDWLSYVKSGEVLGENPMDKQSAVAQVQMHYRTPDEEAVTSIDIQVEQTHLIETPHSTASEKLYEYPQYRVVKQESQILNGVMKKLN